jgi:6-phosphogluconolactonase/glucosamine-6-phosphate isomerase/deaminase
MQFIRTSDWQPGIDDLYNRLQRSLDEHHQVLWLVSGGSNIPASVEIMRRLSSASTARLSVMLCDERFGPVGHQNSNAAQLDAAGFAPKQATVIAVLVAGLDLTQTAQHYQDAALSQFKQADVVIGQLGIGPNGHIAGIQPHSPAASSPDFVSAYTAGDYQRLTLTAHALKRLAAAYCFAFGDSKQDALERLHDQSLSYDDEPSQILKELPEAYVYNDQIGDRP